MQAALVSVSHQNADSMVTKVQIWYLPCCSSVDAFTETKAHANLMPYPMYSYTSLMLQQSGRRRVGTQAIANAMLRGFAHRAAFLSSKE